MGLEGILNPIKKALSTESELQCLRLYHESYQLTFSAMLVFVDSDDMIRHLVAG